MKPFVLLALAIATATVTVTPALADVVVFNGDTTSGPTYNRALTGRPPTGLSAVGTAVRYQVTDFTVSVSGNYDFLNSSIHDSFLGIHINAFNPANALQNALAYDDDAGPGSDSSITALGLLAGTNYFAVRSGFGNTDFGAFTLTISGPGRAERIGQGPGPGVPEPSTWAMMIIGFGAAGSMIRRRKAVTA